MRLHRMEAGRRGVICLQARSGYQLCRQHQPRALHSPPHPGLLDKTTFPLQLHLLHTGWMGQPAIPSAALRKPAATAPSTSSMACQGARPAAPTLTVH